MKTRISTSLLMPLTFELGLFDVCSNEEEIAEVLVYQLSEELDALLDDDDIKNMSSDNMAAVIGGILNALGAHSVRTQSSYVDKHAISGYPWPHYTVWFSFTTSPFRSFRHTDYINISLF